MVKRIKNHSRTGLEIQFKDLNRKRGPYQHISCTMPAKRKKFPKVEKLKTNKNIIVAKTLENFTMKAKFDSIKLSNQL